MNTVKPSNGIFHATGNDLTKALRASDAVVALWESLTPIARNEFICWIEDAKQTATRSHRIERTVQELKDGQRRPCCWVGCVHRTDKEPGQWQKDVLIDKKPRS